MKNCNIEKYEKALNKTLELMRVYKKTGIKIPGVLKGNLGEFIIIVELIKRFSESSIDFRGGTYPGIDLLLGNVKIQVKTQIKHSAVVYGRGQNKGKGIFDFESSPTIKGSSMDNRVFDIITLVIVYLGEESFIIGKKNIYVFDKSDFGLFSHKFCWSGKSKGDYTIVNVLKAEGDIPPKQKESIEFYNKPKYKKLFKESKNNWNKIKLLLK